VTVESISDSIERMRIWETIPIHEKVRDAWFIRTTLFRVIPFWRPPTRLERIQATIAIDLIRDLYDDEYTKGTPPTPTTERRTAGEGT
jgi:hypothetical protein